MASGFKAIYENAKYDIILFLENDFCTYCSKEEVHNYLENAVDLIKTGKADAVRGRSRTNAGYPNYAYINLRGIPPSSFVNNTHLAKCIVICV